MSDQTDALKLFNTVGYFISLGAKFDPKGERHFVGMFEDFTGEAGKRGTPAEALLRDFVFHMGCGQGVFREPFVIDMRSAISQNNELSPQEQIVRKMLSTYVREERRDAFEQFVPRILDENVSVGNHFIKVFRLPSGCTFGGARAIILQEGYTPCNAIALFCMLEAVLYNFTGKPGRAIARALWSKWFFVAPGATSDKQGLVLALGDDAEKTLYAGVYKDTDMVLDHFLLLGQKVI